jgi:cytochrome b561
MPQPRTWTRTARVLHWTTAGGLAIIVPAGFIMTRTYLAAVRGGPLAWAHIRASQVHHTLGLLLLVLAIGRLWWRLRHPAPPMPQGTRTILPRMVQAMLYGLLLVLPLSGWAALSSLGAADDYPAPSMWFFTHDGFAPGGLIPHLVPPRPWNDPGLLTYGTFARAHVYLLWAGAGLLCLHVAGGLWHHFVRGDGVLRAMLGKG